MLESTIPAGASPTNVRSEGDGPRCLRVCPRHLAKLEKGLRDIIAPSEDRAPAFLIWVAGVPGAGKTTLVAGGRARLGGEGVLFISGQGYPGTGEILEPILRAARSLIDKARGEAERGAPGWSAIWDEIVARHAPALDRVLPEIDWGREVEPYPNLEPEYERARLLDHLAGLFLRVAEELPTVICIDGAEHLDQLGRELLIMLARVVRTRTEGRSAGLPLPPPPRLGLILCTSTDDAPPLPLTDAEVLPVSLRGLGRDEFARLLRREYGEEMPLSLREKLYQRTQGNPLDLTFRIARERASGEPGGPLERLKRLLELGTFEQQITSDVRGADPEYRRLLQALAVLVKPISVPLAARILDRDADDVTALFPELEKEMLLQRYPGGAIGLAHERLRRPVLETLTDAERRDLHRRAAEVIENEYHRRPHRRFQEVYYHYFHGPRDTTAIEAGYRAAEEAWRLYDFQGAIRIYRDLIETLPLDDSALLGEGIASLADLLARSRATDERLLCHLERILETRGDELEAEARAGIWRRLGAVAGRWDLADRELACYRRGLAAIEDLSRSQERIVIYAAIARCFLRRRQFEETLDYCRQGIERSQLDELTSDPEFLEICRVTEEAHYHRGEIVEALGFEEQYLRLARVEGSPLQVFESLLLLGHLYEQQGRGQDAQRCLLEALPVARSTGSRLLEARVDERLGYLHARQEDWESSTRAFRRALEVHTEIGEEERTVRIFGALGMVALFTGDAESGARSFRLYALYQGLRRKGELPPQVPSYPCDYRSRSERDEEIRLRMETIARGSNVTPRVMTDAHSELADLRRDRGEFEVARATLRRGLRTAVVEKVGPARFHLQLGILHRMQGEAQEALACFQMGLDSMQDRPERELVAEFNVQVGLLYGARGEYEKAIKSIVRGLRSYLEQEHETGVAHALLHLADVYRVVGCRDAAEELALAGLALADSLGVERLEAESWLLLANLRHGGDGQTPGHQEVVLARDLYHRLGILEGRARTLLVEAEIFLHWGDLARAQSLCAESIDITRDLGLRPLLARALAVRGRIEGDPRTRGGDFLRALKSLESSLEHAEAIGDRDLAQLVHGAMAWLYHERNRPGAAREHLLAAAKGLEEMATDCPERYREGLRHSRPWIQLSHLYNLDVGESVGAAERPVHVQLPDLRFS